MLDAEIRARNMTLDEFAHYAETYARDHGETGTLSARHLQRLIADAAVGRTRDLRPATRRLLEQIFGAPVTELLRPIDGPPAGQESDDQGDAARLAQRIDVSRRVDTDTVRLFAEQIETTHRLDRRFGAATLLGALRLHAEHMEDLLRYCTMPDTCRALAAVLTDAHTLAGWQSLDRGETGAAWDHYRRACDAARESPALHAHALAEQAVVIADIGQTADGAQMSAHARTLGGGGSPLLRAWLAAAHGEALAADGRSTESLHAYDDANRLLPARPTPVEDGPYLALDGAHLARWRSHALARFGHPDAIPVLSAALEQHDAEFSRAEAGLRTDLVMARVAVGELDAARRELIVARRIADAIGSARQGRRLACVAVNAA